MKGRALAISIRWVKITLLTVAAAVAFTCRALCREDSTAVAAAPTAKTECTVVSSPRVGPFVMELRIEKGEVPLGLEDTVVCVEIHNVTIEPQRLYKHGFAAVVTDFVPDRSVGPQHLPPDRIGPIGMRMIQSEFADPQDNVVLLEPNAYYGVAFRCNVMAPGVIRWSVEYSSEEAEIPGRTSVWKGTISAVKSDPVRIVADAEVLKQAASAMKTEKDPQTRAILMNALQNATPGSVPIMRDALRDDPDENVKHNAAYGLAGFAREDLGPPLNPLEFEKVLAWADAYIGDVPKKAGSDGDKRAISTKEGERKRAERPLGSTQSDITAAPPAPAGTKEPEGRGLSEADKDVLGDRVLTAALKHGQGSIRKQEVFVVIAEDKPEVYRFRVIRVTQATIAITPLGRGTVNRKTLAVNGVQIMKDGMTEKTIEEFVPKPMPEGIGVYGPPYTNEIAGGAVLAWAQTYGLCSDRENDSLLAFTREKPADSWFFIGEWDGGKAAFGGTISVDSLRIVSVPVA